MRPVCVALVDVTGTEEHLELVRCSLLAALEALPPCTAFGLATFSDKVITFCHHVTITMMQQQRILQNYA